MPDKQGKLPDVVKEEVCRAPSNTPTFIYCQSNPVNPSPVGCSASPCAPRPTSDTSRPNGFRTNGGSPPGFDAFPAASLLVPEQSRDCSGSRQVHGDSEKPSGRHPAKTRRVQPRPPLRPTAVRLGVSTRSRGARRVREQTLIMRRSEMKVFETAAWLTNWLP